MYGEIRGMYSLFQHYTTQIVETKKNRKDETMKKPEIIQDYNNYMQGVHRAAKFCNTDHVAWKLWNGLRNLCSFCYTWPPWTVSYCPKNIQMKFRSAKAVLPRTWYLTVYGKMMEPEGGEDENDSAGCITNTKTANHCWWRIQLHIHGVDSKNIKWFTFDQAKK